MLEGPHGAEVLHALKFGFKASNNESAYETLILGFKHAKDMGAKWFQALSDSMFIIQQFKSEYETKGENMAKYLGVVQALFFVFPS